jgi:dTDP-4-dehydrorhamnose 3,5-epimerase-like enzyme
MAKQQLPVQIEKAISHDPALVGKQMGLTAEQMKAKGATNFDDKVEESYFNSIKTGYIRCVNAGNANPTAEHIVGAGQGKIKSPLAEFVKKGNFYRKLSMCILDNKDSLVWKVAVAIAMDPAKYGFDTQVALAANVEFIPTGKKSTELPK